MMVRHAQCLFLTLRLNLVNRDIEHEGFHVMYRFSPFFTPGLHKSVRSFWIGLMNEGTEVQRE